jgi:hypothetical protein
LNFYNQATTNQLTLNTRRLKIGWGKHSGALNAALVQAVKSGASRNVYLGQIQDFEKFTADKLKQDFGQYGGEYTLCPCDRWWLTHRYRNGQLLPRKECRIRQLVSIDKERV